MSLSLRKLIRYILFKNVFDLLYDIKNKKQNKKYLIEKWKVLKKDEGITDIDWAAEA